MIARMGFISVPIQDHTEAADSHKFATALETFGDVICYDKLDDLQAGVFIVNDFEIFLCFVFLAIARFGWKSGPDDANNSFVQTKSTANE